MRASAVPLGKAGKCQDLLSILVFFSVRVEKKSLTNIFHSKGKEIAMKIFETRSDKPAHSHVVALSCLLILSWGTLCIFLFDRLGSNDITAFHSFVNGQSLA